MNVKGYLFFLFTLLISVNVQAQIELNKIVFGAQIDVVEFEEGFFHDDSFKNSLKSDVDVYLSKRRFIFWRNERGAFNDDNDNISSNLPQGDRKHITDFSIGDYLIFQIPYEAFLKNGEFNGVKIVFEHTFVTEETAIYLYDDQVKIVFEIIDIMDERKDHILGHICEPNDPECLPDDPTIDS